VKKIKKPIFGSKNEKATHIVIVMRWGFLLSLNWGESL
jgi:hypothetical protein